MSTSIEQPKGLLRITSFFKVFIAAVKDQQHDRSSTFKSLINPEYQVSDIYVTLIVAILLYITRFCLEKHVFPKLFNQFSRRVQKKLAENLFYSMYYIVAFTYFLFYVYLDAEWRVNLISNKSNVLQALLIPFPPSMNSKEHFYYAQAGGFYLAAVTWLFTDTKRSDFMELALHHVVTIGLVAVSYAYGYVRTGMLILGLHDIGDIFLYSAKFIHYLGLKGLDTAVFAVFAITFYITRLVMYSRMVRMIFIDTLRAVVEQPNLNNWAKYYDTYLWHYFFFISFLGILLVLHCFWFTLILKMIYRELFLGKKISDEGDVRSDNESDDDQMTSFTEEDDEDDISAAKKKH